MCPECAKSIPSNQFVQSQLDVVCDNEYEMNGDFNGYGQRVMIKHKPCGKESKVVLFERLFEGRSCACKRCMDITQAQENVDEIAEGYEVVSIYISNGEKYLSLKHIECGGIFSVRMSEFRQHTFCRCCNSGRRNRWMNSEKK